MPSITIAPKTKCEISTVVTIDIQPNELGRVEHRNRQQNNLKLVHCVHAAATSEICDEPTNHTENVPREIPVEEVRNKTETDVPSDDNQNQANASSQVNKYYKPFSSDNNERKKPIAVIAREEDILHNETSSSLVESISINLSASSILSDTFAFDALPRKHIVESRNPVESIINDIFENATKVIVDERPVQTIDIQRTFNSDAFQLRDLLDKIRNDKTSLDLAIERKNTMDYVSNADKLDSPVVLLRTNREEPIETSSSNISIVQKIDGIDKSVQCDTLGEMILKAESTDQTDDRRLPKRKSRTRTKVRRDLNEDMLRSPKFTKTLNSIRSSARKLNFDGQNGKYKTATPEQIQTAATKFLNSLITDGNSTRPNRRDDDSDSDSLNSYILAPPKYRVIDDKIIQSQYNNILHCHTSTLTSDSTINSVLPPGIVSGDEINASTSSSSIDLRLSSLRLRSPRSGPQPNERPNIGDRDLNGNISDGEVLSEGEIRPEEGNE